jgi:predicted ArsR family transcriptional regulator
MAQVEPLADGAFLFIENHCPIRSAAQLCGGLCHHEQEIFGVILGQGIRLERTEHLLSGQRRCVYRVWEAS